MLLVDRRLTHGVEKVKRASVTDPLLHFFANTVHGSYFDFNGSPAWHSFKGVDLRKYRSLEALPPLRRCEWFIVQFTRVQKRNAFFRKLQQTSWTGRQEIGQSTCGEIVILMSCETAEWQMLLRSSWFISWTLWLDFVWKPTYKASCRCVSWRISWERELYKLETVKGHVKGYVVRYWCKKWFARLV